MRAGRIPPEAEIQLDAVTGPEFVRAGELELFHALRDEAMLRYRGRFFDGPAPIVTALLVGFQVRVWWFAQVPDLRYLLVGLFTNWAPPVLENGQVWRPVTMGLLHTDAMHLLLNMLWLGYTGWNLERALGRANLVAIYFASVLGGSLLSMFWSPWTQSLGASGGVFGLIAASVVFGFVRPEMLPLRGRRWFGPAMLPYLLLMFWSGWQNATTDNWAHLGGLITGALLGLVVAPDELERRRNASRTVRIATAVTSVALLVGLYLFGPRLHPIYDSEEGRALSRPRSDRPRTPASKTEPGALQFGVPGGWFPGVDLARSAAFVSPARDGAGRAFGVTLRDDEKPQDLTTAATAWADRLREEWPDAEIGAPKPTVIAGRDGLALEARVVVRSVPEDGGRAAVEERRIVEWRGTTRGVWVLSEVWQVEEAQADRLAPLRDRLRARVVFSDPPELVSARRDALGNPRNLAARTRLARELARVGEVEEALALSETLVAEAPTDPARHVALIEILAELGPAVPDADPILDRALAASDVPKVVIAVADALDDLGRTDDARGLLTLAWSAAPGDRMTQRARRRRSMPTELDAATGEPWERVHDPVTGALRTPPEATGAPLGLASARGAAAVLAADREAAVTASAAAVRAGDRRGIVPLLVLKDGFVAAADTDARGALADDLDRVVSGSPPDWVPPEVAAAVADRPDYPSVVRNTP